MTTPPTIRRSPAVSDQASSTPPSADADATANDRLNDDPVNPDHYRRHPSGIEAIQITEHFNPNIAATTVAQSKHLRYRVAYAIAQADGDPEGMEPASCDYEMADAVIRELGLRPELGQRSKPTGPLWGANNRYNVTRYVTEWKNNDE